jgi:flagellar hook protein FlgE
MSFQQGLSGLNASAKSLDALGNNIANSGTVGFKSASTEFSDVFAAALGGGGQVGIGTSVSGVKQSFGQGNITTTSSPLDLAINGQGFFRLNTNGTTSWSRNGQFNVDKDGYIVNASGAKLTGYLADASNTIVPSSPQDVFINTASLKPQPTGTDVAGSGPGVKLGVNLDSREPIRPAGSFIYTSPTTYNSSTSVSVFDSLGVGHVMTMYFCKDSPLNWSVFAGIDQGDPTLVANPFQALTFDTSGALSGYAVQSVNFPAALFNPATGAADLTFKLNLTGSTQYGNVFGVDAIAQDGYTSGRLAGLSVASDGTIQGRYSNGQTRDLAQVVLGNFANPNGLTSLGNNQWSETADSGQPLIGVPASGSLGLLQSAAIEESNVDLTAELVQMITQQRAYQANAQSIKTQDSVLQTLVNLR